MTFWHLMPWDMQHNVLGELYEEKLIMVSWYLLTKWVAYCFITIWLLYFIKLLLFFKRFSRSDKKSKLPKWIQEHLRESFCNLSVEEAIQVLNAYLYPLQKWTQVFVVFMGCKKTVYVTTCLIICL